MGQYHIIHNLDKREFLHPHKLGDGLKLREFAESAGGTMTALAYLLAHPTCRGGGDYHNPGPNAGRWRGDRLAIIGDYAEPSDLAGTNAGDIDPTKLDSKDISQAVRAELEHNGVEMQKAWG